MINEPELLAACYRCSLQLAVQHGLKSIAFPAISCGVYRFPIGQAAQIAVTEVTSLPEDRHQPGARHLCLF